MTCEKVISSYSIEEFISHCINGGYASRHDKKKIREWCEKQSRGYYTDSDFVDVYRYLSNRRIGSRYPYGKWQSSFDSNGKTTKHYSYDDYGSW